jgi:hypothetical protein
VVVEVVHPVDLALGREPFRDAVSDLLDKHFSLSFVGEAFPVTGKAHGRAASDDAVPNCLATVSRSGDPQIDNTILAHRLPSALQA